MRSFRPHPLKLLLFPVLLGTFTGSALAQARIEFVPGTSSLSAYSHSIVLSPVTDPPCPPPEEITDSQGGFNTLPTGRIYGGAYTLIKRGLPNCKISAQGTANVFIDGDGGNLVFVRWWLHSITQYDCYDPDCLWSATDTSSMSASLRLVLAGLPPGTPVQVSYMWEHFSSYANRPEAGMEDEAAVENASLNLFGQVGFGGNMDITGTQRFGQNLTGDTTQTFTMLIGDTLDIDVAGLTRANIDPPARPVLNEREDDASADFYGYCYIWVNGPNSPLVTAPDSCDDETILYSVDIGSDMEFSDPSPDGAETLDPGDIYAESSPIANPPMFDDAFLFGSDPNPSFGNPAGTCVPGPLQGSQFVLNFDLDGTDRIDLDLAINPGQFGFGQPSIPFFASNCIYTPDYALISFDEDRGINFNSAINCNVPSAFDPMDSIMVRGTVDEHDEVMTARLYQVQGTTTFTGSAMPYVNEDELSSLLSPSPPTQWPADRNDDVDALDIVADPTACGNLYLSVDHEASYTFGSDTLDPGAIYQAVAPGILVKVIDPTLHLGLLPGVDLDAFEFTWLYDFLNQRYGLALAFSVSAADPFSPVDYTAGLDPSFIYGSFLNGYSFEMVAAVAPYNIDGIAFSCDPVLAYGSTFVPPSILVGLGPEQGLNDHVLSVYPNPNNGSFQVVLTAERSASANLKIFGIDGKSVHTRTLNLSKGQNTWDIQMETLDAGIYFLEIELMEKGNATSRLLREKITLLR